jgi:hypothetical protein
MGMLETTTLSEAPIAYTLSPGQYKDRTGELAALAAQALRSRELTTDGEQLTFTDTPETERELRAVIAAESSCCAFLRMELNRIGEGLVLDIAGPPDARPVIAELFA